MKVGKGCNFEPNDDHPPGAVVRIHGQIFDFHKYKNEPDAPYFLGVVLDPNKIDNKTRNAIRDK